MVDTKLVKEYEKIIKNSNNESAINSINKQTKFDKINFLYFKIKNPNSGSTITIFKKFVKPQTTLRQAMRVRILGEKMKRVKEDVLYLDNTVSSFEYNGKFYIFDRNHFNSLFKFRDMYNRLIDNSSKEIKDCEFINNPEAFIENCKNNGHLVKKIAKLIISKGFKNVKENRERIPQIIKNHNLKIKLDENKQIIYEEENTKEILDLLLDNYVKTELTDKNAIAKALSYEGEE